ncbi:penicillin-binding transpeptidase domain-containing protein [Zemynaea arenosa]|uniref:penicillin-binding transpeptidase domain-containing protein n=1 Tax=Zemynaea arenosa TaxID=2561931 RepID=UPI001E505CF1|nr:penicillin-binding transpeptidase domain-containing protein [Massilia arenosa]
MLVAGGALIAGHARHLATAVSLRGGDAGSAGLDVLQPLLPGAAFDVPDTPVFQVVQAGSGALIVAPGAIMPAPVRVDLCQQTVDAARSRLATLRVGYRFDALARMVGEQGEGAMRPGLARNALVLADDAPATPTLDITGRADRREPLAVRWNEGPAIAARWVSDTGRAGQAASGTREGTGTFDREGWLVWSAGAVRLQRRVTAACPQSGELLVSVLRVGQSQSADALVTAIAPGLASMAVTLKPGRYQIPAVPRPGLEDQTLFVQLQAHGLLRLADDGLIELAPRDLPAWRAAEGSERAAVLNAWTDVRLDDDTLKLLKRLYRMADGDYVRQQVDIFNAERRLLAVRVKSPGSAPTAPATPTALAAPAWQADVADAATATSDTMPPAASALFAQLPQGWSSWTRISQWPATATTPRARLVLSLTNRPAAARVDSARVAVAPSPVAAAARVTRTIEVMLAGRLLSVSGATIESQRDACTGRVCPDRAAVRIYTLAPHAGADTIALEATPLSMATLANPGDAKYRHIRIADGRLIWQTLDETTAPARAPAHDITIADRNGTPLWTDGAPTDDARAAGLAPLLGLRTDQSNSVAGMLARLTDNASAHAAQLTIDLPLQQLAQRTLDCIAMHRGHWTGHACTNAKPSEPAQGRHAGVVIMDADTGDIRASAGAGMGDPYASPWPELRDFDRANPAASPLRLPAWQHDGGVHNSPGSTFKVISALGLELAARRDPQMEQLLAGLPLNDINRVAQQRGFAFRTDAATYPMQTTRAHVTNYRDGLLDRRAQEGRFGLAQALTYSLNTWFAWNGELSDRTLLGRSAGGLPDVEALEPGALDTARPILAMAHLVGFERPIKLDGGLLPTTYPWHRWDALQASNARIDRVDARHELRQMAIGLRMQTTPLHMAMAAGAVGQGRVLAPRLLLQLDGRSATAPQAPALDVRLDRIRAGMKGVVDRGTAAGAFRASELAAIRTHLYGKTGTAPTVAIEADGTRRDVATVWFTGWLEPGALPGHRHRLAFAAYASHSDGTGGEHAAPVIAAILATLSQTPPQNRE